MSNSSQVFGGINSVAVTTTDGQLLTWGKNESDILGHLKSGHFAANVVETPVRIDQISVGMNQMLMIGSIETKKSTIIRPDPIIDTNFGQLHEPVSEKKPEKFVTPQPVKPVITETDVSEPSDLEKSLADEAAKIVNATLEKSQKKYEKFESMVSEAELEKNVSEKEISQTETSMSQPKESIKIDETNTSQLNSEIISKDGSQIKTETDFVQSEENLMSEKSSETVNQKPVIPEPVVQESEQHVESENSPHDHLVENSSTFTHAEAEKFIKKPKESHSTLLSESTLTTDTIIDNNLSEKSPEIASATLTQNPYPAVRPPANSNYKGKNFDPNYRKSTPVRPNLPPWAKSNEAQAVRQTSNYQGKNFDPNFRPRHSQPPVNSNYQGKNFIPNFRPSQPRSPAQLNNLRVPGKSNYQGKSFRPNFDPSQNYNRSPSGGSYRPRSRASPPSQFRPRTSQPRPRTTGYQGKNFDPNYRPPSS